MRLRFLLPLFVIILAGCGSKTVTLHSFDGSKTASATVEVADSPKERDKGLMNRTELAPDTGMLFAFPEPQMMAFWMKNTLIPLDILFFDEFGEFVNAVSMEPCKANPCPQYRSAALSQYALEFTPEFRAKHKIGVGWKLDMKKIQRMTNPK